MRAPRCLAAYARCAQLGCVCARASATRSGPLFRRVVLLAALCCRLHLRCCTAGLRVPPVPVQSGCARLLVLRVFCVGLRLGRPVQGLPLACAVVSARAARALTWRGCAFDVPAPGVVASAPLCGRPRLRPSAARLASHAAVCLWTVPRLGASCVGLLAWAVALACPCCSVCASGALRFGHFWCVPAQTLCAALRLRAVAPACTLPRWRLSRPRGCAPLGCASGACALGDLRWRSAALRLGVAAAPRAFAPFWAALVASRPLGYAVRRWRPPLARLGVVVPARCCRCLARRSSSAGLRLWLPVLLHFWRLCRWAACWRALGCASSACALGCASCALASAAGLTSVCLWPAPSRAPAPGPRPPRGLVLAAGLRLCASSQRPRSALRVPVGLRF